MHFKENKSQREIILSHAVINIFYYGHILTALIRDVWASTSDIYFNESIFQTLKNLLEELNKRFSKLTREQTADGWASDIVPRQTHLLSSGYCCISKLDEPLKLETGFVRFGFN